MASLTNDEHDYDDDRPQPQQIRLTIPQRFYLLPGAAILLGTTLGFVRGSRRASLRFLAENVHRPPTTVQGWYFYNKTKNYRVLMGGLKEAGLDAVKLGTTAAGWVCFEQAMDRLDLPWARNLKEVVAGVGTAAVFSLAYRLPRKATGRAIVLGGMIGFSMRGLQWSQEHLRAQAATRAAELEAAVAEGREEVLEDVKEAADSVQHLVQHPKSS